MTDFKEIISNLESDDFSIYISLANSFQSYKRRLANHNAVKKLKDFMIEESKYDKIKKYIFDQIRLIESKENKNYNNIHSVCACILILMEIPADKEIDKFFSNIISNQNPLIKWISNFTRFCDHMRISSYSISGSSFRIYKSINENIISNSKYSTWRKPNYAKTTFFNM